MFKAALLVTFVGLCATEPPVSRYLPAARASNELPQQDTSLADNYVREVTLSKSSAKPQHVEVPSRQFSALSPDYLTPSAEHSASSARFGIPSNEYGAPFQNLHKEQSGYDYRPPAPHLRLQPVPDSSDTSDDQYTSSRSPTTEYGSPTPLSNPSSTQYGHPTERISTSPTHFVTMSSLSSQYDPASEVRTTPSPFRSVSPSQYDVPATIRSTPSPEYGTPQTFRNIPPLQNPPAFRSIPSAHYGIPIYRSSPTSLYGPPTTYSSSAHYPASPVFRSGHSLQDDISPTFRAAPPPHYFDPSQRSIPTVQYGGPSRSYHSPSHTSFSSSSYSTSRGFLGTNFLDQDVHSVESGRYAPGVISAVEEGDQFSRRISHEEEHEIPDAAKYQFNYDVRDGQLGVEFGQEESREGRESSGSYHVLLPDGRRQRVVYTAGRSGYKPTITYEDAEDLTSSRGRQYDEGYRTQGNYISTAGQDYEDGVRSTEVVSRDSHQESYE